MAAPSLSGFTQIRGQNDTANIASSSAIVSVGTSPLNLYFSSSVVSAVNYIELAFDGAQDFTNSAFLISLDARFRAVNTDVKYGLYSTANTDYRLFEVGHGRNVGIFQFLIDPSQTPYEDTGTFDITNVLGCRIQCIPNTGSSGPTNSGIYIYSNFYRIASNNLIIEGGESGDLADTDFIVSEIQSSFPDSSTANATITEPTISSNYANIRTPFNLQLGNNSAVDTGTLPGVIEFQDNQNEVNSSWILTGNPTLRVNANSSFTLAKDIYTEDAANKPYAFTDTSSAAVTYRGNFGGYSSIDAGSNAIFIGNTFAGNGSITGGASFRNGTFDASTATQVIDWDGSTTFTGCEFTGSQTYFIRIGSDKVANDSTFDATGLTFTGTPGTTHFLVDGVTGLTITLNAGESATKTEINGGSATFSTPNTVFTAGNGSAFRMYVIDPGNSNTPIGTGYYADATSHSINIAGGTTVRVAAWQLGQKVKIVNLTSNQIGTAVTIEFESQTAVNTGLDVSSFTANISIDITSEPGNVIAFFNAAMELEPEQCNAVLHQIAGMQNALISAAVGNSGNLAPIFETRIEINSPTFTVRRNESLANTDRVELLQYIDVSTAVAQNANYILNPSDSAGFFVIYNKTEYTFSPQAARNALLRAPSPGLTAATGSIDDVLDNLDVTVDLSSLPTLTELQDMITVTRQDIAKHNE